jgi:hypothetical protein
VASSSSFVHQPVRGGCEQVQHVKRLGRVSGTGRPAAQQPRVGAVQAERPERDRLGEGGVAVGDDVIVCVMTRVLSSRYAARGR